MKIPYGISHWTNVLRRTYHINTGKSRPLYGGKRQKKAFNWEWSNNELTCRQYAALKPKWAFASHNQGA